LDLVEFLAQNERIDLVEVISFPPLPPRFLALAGAKGRVAYLTTEMRDIKERLEIGVLKFLDQGDPPKSGVKETLSGGRVRSFEYLAAPGFDVISGVRIRLDSGDLIVTAGDAPYSIFIAFGEVRRGRPEYPIDQYRSIRAT
jgi:hypothetical protein